MVMMSVFDLESVATKGKKVLKNIYDLMWISIAENSTH